MSPTPKQRKFTLDLLTEWRRLGLPFDSGTVILAVSGGTDSCALAAAVSDLRSRKKLHGEFIAAHFDHGLRADESRKDAEFVRHLSGELGFGFELGKAPRSLSGSRSNIEEKARNARYSFLSELAASRGAGHVLTAHTMNDQAETLLINLIRGAGVTGLSGMDSVRPLDEPPGGTGGDSAAGPLLCRPLLSWAERADTEEYVCDCGISAREDPMNVDIAFQRVKVRRELIPLLKEFNPSIVRTLSTVSEVLSFEKEVFRGGLASIAEAAELAASERIRISDLSKLPFAARVFAVREWLGRRRGDLRGIDLKHCKSVVNLAGSGKSGNRVELPRSGSVAKRSGYLLFEDAKVEK